MILLSFGLRGQHDTSITVPLVGMHFGGQVPYGDLAERFGPNLNAGGSFAIKTSRNWIFGIESNYFFGRNVREDVLVQLRNEDGFIIDNEGYPADLRVTERGVGVHFFGGKILPFLKANNNSGIVITVGAGAMQHRIKLYDAQQRIAGVQDDLASGYDRLSLGYSFTQFVGYLFLSDYRMLNFYAGFEFYQAYTRSVRGYNYDTAQPDKDQRLDGLAGFRFGWILPLHKKTPDDYYYY